MLLIQALKGLQFGLILFLIAASLTLVFGLMNFITTFGRTSNPPASSPRPARF